MQPGGRGTDSRNRGTLLSKLLLGFLVFVPIPLAVLGWLAGNYLFHSFRQHSLRTSSSFALDIAHAIRLIITDARTDLQVLARIPDIAEHHSTTSQSILKSMIAENRHFSAITLLDERGQVFAATRVNLVGGDYSCVPCFREVRSSLNPFILTHKSRVTGERIITVAVPLITSGGVFRGVAAGDIALDAIQREALIHIEPNSMGVLMMNEGPQPIFILPSALAYRIKEIPELHSRIQKAKEKPGAFEFQSPSTGQLFLISNAPVPELGWNITVVELASQAYAATYRLRFLFILFLILATLIWVCGIVIIARRVTYPLSYLTEKAQEISMGNYDMFPVIHTNDEIETLSEVLSDMTNKIKSQIVELEESHQRVSNAFYQVGNVLSRGEDLDVLLQFIVERVSEATKSDYGALFLYDESDKMLVVRAGYHPPSEMVPLIGQYRIKPDEGIAGWAFSRRESVIVTNAQEDPRYQLISPYRERYYVGSVLAVPITYDGETIGVIDLFSSKTNMYSENDLALVEPIASQAGVAIRNAQLFSQVRRQLQEMEAVQAISRAISTSDELDEIVRLGLTKATSIAGMDTGAAFLIDVQSGKLVLHSTVGVSPDVMKDENYRNEIDPLLWETIQSRTPLAVSRALEDPIITSSQALLNKVRELQIASTVMVPMIARDTAIGVVKLTSTAVHEFSPDELNLLQAIANQLALGIRNSSLLAQAVKASEDLRRSFYRIGLALASPLDLQKTLNLIVELAAEQMGTNRSALLLLENDILEVRAEIGLGQQFIEEYRPAVGECLAGWVAQTRNPLAAREIASDPRGSTWEESIAPGAVSFLGVPVLYQNDLIGVLCVFADRPRVFTQEETALLSTFASQAAIAIQNARLYEREHQVALTFQRSLLPPSPPAMESVRIVAYYHPATRGLEVGGDYYDYIVLGDGRFGIVIADVSGKGLDAAVHAAMGKYFLRAYALEDPSPGVVLTRVNNALSQFMPSGCFITLLYGVMDTNTKQLHYSSGGHEPQVICCPQENTIELLYPTGKLLGVVSGETYNENLIELHANDTLILYTDGLSDARQNGDTFGVEGIQRVVMEHMGEPVEKTAQHLYQSAMEFQGGPLRDDAALVLINVL